MIERNIKKLLLEALNETGDNPEDVSCVYAFDYNCVMFGYQVT